MTQWQWGNLLITMDNHDFDWGLHLVRHDPELFGRSGYALVVDIGFWGCVVDYARDLLKEKEV